jgi:hypothetical protein
MQYAASVALSSARINVLYDATSNPTTIAFLKVQPPSSSAYRGKREAQFMRLRDQIEERAVRRFLAMEFESTPSGIILRSLDFPNVA